MHLQENIKTFAKEPDLLERISERAYREALSLPEEVTEEYEFLARGEYNENFFFIHPKNGKRYVLRVNHGSQMHLKKQISYEAHALSLLEKSGRVPKVYYVDEKGEKGILLMDFLEGRALRYETDLSVAGQILADIHSTEYAREKDRGELRLLSPENPLYAMLSESASLLRTYELSPFKEDSVYERCHALWEKGVNLAEKYAKTLSSKDFCIINTELNSGNFLIQDEEKTLLSKSELCGQKEIKREMQEFIARKKDSQLESCSHLIDWEKPLYAHFAQDLGHFLAPTTSFWKTDCILHEKERVQFFHAYKEALAGRRGFSGIEEKTELFILFNCIRGLSWCAYAYAEYQKGRDIQNEDTFRKIKAYLTDPFLSSVEELFRESQIKSYRN